MLKRFRHQFSVKAPLEDVVEYHSHANVLKRLTPPPVFLKFHEVEPLADGASVSFTIWLGALPVPWRATYTEVDPTSGFTDSLTEGPYEHWVHRHRFIAIDERTTSVTDEIEAIPGGSFYRKFVSQIMWFTLPLLFTYRKFRTRFDLERSMKRSEATSGSEKGSRVNL